MVLLIEFDSFVRLNLASFVGWNLFPLMVAIRFAKCDAVMTGSRLMADRAYCSEPISVRIDFRSFGNTCRVALSFSTDPCEVVTPKGVNSSPKHCISAQDLVTDLEEICFPIR